MFGFAAAGLGEIGSWTGEHGNIPDQNMCWKNMASQMSALAFHKQKGEKRKVKGKTGFNLKVD